MALAVGAAAQLHATSVTGATLVYYQQLTKNQTTAPQLVADTVPGNATPNLYFYSGAAFLNSGNGANLAPNIPSDLGPVYCAGQPGCPIWNGELIFQPAVKIQGYFDFFVLNLFLNGNTSTPSISEVIPPLAQTIESQGPPASYGYPNLMTYNLNGQLVLASNTDELTENGLIWQFGGNGYEFNNGQDLVGEFNNVPDGNYDYYFYFGDFLLNPPSLSSAPEPSSFGLGTLAVAMLTFAAHKRRAVRRVK